jgi:NAD+ diphosphatase
LLRGMAYQKSFLGVQSDGSALFSLDILDKDFDPATAVIDPSSSSSSSSWVDTRTGAPLFSAPDRAAVLYATALARWQRKTRYCCQCGGPITFIDAGSCAECDKCHDKSWPRQDPSMIAIILSPHRERVLLARSKRHPPKVYSTLAGFVEAGETMEAAVAREAWEEAGVRVDINSVRYVASQPWPFPQSTMLGFSAIADDKPPLQINPNEIECAQWFEKQQVLEAAHAGVGLATMQDSVAHSLGSARPDLKLILPPKGVIARQLLDAWLEDKLHD